MLSKRIGNTFQKTNTSHANILLPSLNTKNVLCSSKSLLLNCSDVSVVSCRVSCQLLMN